MPSLTARLVRFAVRRSIKPTSINDRFVEQIPGSARATDALVARLRQNNTR